MHKGRTYPYAPKFWATEAWFWPGFVPWKMFFERGISDGDPWNQIPIGYTKVSNEVFYTTDAKEASWVWPLDDIAVGLALAVTLSKTSVGATRFAFAGISLNDPSAITPSLASTLQTYPQDVVFVPNFFQLVPTPPYSYVGDVNISIRPATYAEGGSPW